MEMCLHSIVTSKLWYSINDKLNKKLKKNQALFFQQDTLVYYYYYFFIRLFSFNKILLFIKKLAFDGFYPLLVVLKKSIFVVV